MNAWEWQQANMVKKSIRAIQEGHDVNDAVIILHHSPVYTMGTRSSEEYLLFDKKQPPCDLLCDSALSWLLRYLGLDVE